MKRSTPPPDEFLEISFTITELQSTNPDLVAKRIADVITGERRYGYPALDQENSNPPKELRYHLDSVNDWCVEFDGTTVTVIHRHNLPAEQKTALEIWLKWVFRH